MIKQIQYLIPSHIKRKGNATADYLANWGCQHPERSIDARPTEEIWDVELHSLQLIVGKDLQPPDQGDQLAARANRGTDCGTLAEATPPTINTHNAAPS